MFGIGWSEFLVIVCIVIIFIRPKDLPAILQKVGKAYGQVKRAYREIVSVKDQFVNEMNAAAAESTPVKGNSSEPHDSESPNSQSSNEQDLPNPKPISEGEGAQADASTEKSLYNMGKEERL
jgi:Sec-independent protein translocase protein TatA